MWVLALVALLSVLCNWAVWQMLRSPAFITAPAIVADVPYFPQDWSGLA